MDLLVVAGIPMVLPFQRFGKTGVSGGFSTLFCREQTSVARTRVRGVYVVAGPHQLSSPGQHLDPWQWLPPLSGLLLQER